MEYRIWPEWNDLLAENEYGLYKFVRKERNHSCYSCYDAWKRERNKCSNNCDRWELVRHGDRAWAKRQAEHYKIEIEN